MQSKDNTISIYELLYYNFFPLIIFEIIYKAFGSFIVFPFFLKTLRTLITGLGGSLITTDNFRLIFQTPSNIFILLVIAILFSYYFLIEISVILVGFKYSSKRKRVFLITLLKEGLLNSFRFLSIKNWIAFPLVLIFLPLLQVGLKSNISELLYLFSYIEIYTGVIITRSIIISSIIVELILIYFFSMVFVFFVEYKVNIFTAIYMEVNLLKEKFFNQIKSETKVLLYTALILLALFISAVLIIFIIYITTIYFNIEGGLSTNTSEIYREIINFCAPCLVGYFFINSILSPLFFFSGFYGIYFNLKKKPKKDKYLRFGNTVKTALIVLFTIFYSFFQGTAIAAEITDDAILITQTGGILTGHRGNVAEEFDNTAASFTNAISNGAEYIELDVLRTADGVLVVQHSNRLETKTGQIFNIEETNYEDLKDVVLGTNERATTPNQHILTLDEAIELIKGNAKLNLEIKTIQNSEGYVQQVIDTVKAHDFLDQTFIASNNYLYVQEAEDIDENVNSLFLTNSNYGDIENLNMDSLSLEHSAITQELVDRIHLRGKTIHAWTLNSEELINQMLDLGVDYLIVDDVRMGQNALSNYRPDQFSQLFGLLERLIVLT